MISLSEQLQQNLSNSAEHIREHLSGPVQTAFIGRPGIELAHDAFEKTWDSPYTGIPDYPVRGSSGVSGSVWELRDRDRGLLVFSRRPHLYEGYEEWELGYPVHLAAALGVTNLLTFSAAGGLKGSYYPGLIVLIEDFINFPQVSPLRGLHDESGGSFFAPMQEVLAPALAKLAQRAAEELNERLSWGTYLMVRGPQFETPAELQMLCSLGAELIGMSTVPELICAKAHGLHILPLALVTNMPLQVPADDEQVGVELSRASGRISALLRRIVDLMYGDADDAR